MTVFQVTLSPAATGTGVEIFRWSMTCATFSSRMALDVMKIVLRRSKSRVFLYCFMRYVSAGSVGEMKCQRDLYLPFLSGVASLKKEDEESEGIKWSFRIGCASFFRNHFTSFNWKVVYPSICMKIQYGDRVIVTCKLKALRVLSS